VAAAGEEFTIGRRSLLDLLDAQRDFVLAQQTLIEAEEQLLLSGYAALALTGDILPAFGVALQDGL
jgi:outer membrane protein TolC